MENKIEAGDSSKEQTSSHREQHLVRLLPCPFCGNENPQYMKNGDMWEGMMHDVHCHGCVTTMSDYSREKVEEKWNLRSLPNATMEAPNA